MKIKLHKGRENKLNFFLKKIVVYLHPRSIIGQLLECKIHKYFFNKMIFFKRFLC